MLSHCTTRLPHMASALAQFLLAPWMGALADRFGRRPFILLALSGLALTNLAFLVVGSSAMYIVLRFLQGALSVGMLPAAMGVVADLVPEQHRTRRVGELMSGYALGFTCGPLMGGLLSAWWGDLAPFGGAFLLDLLALFVAWMRVPETREVASRHRQQAEGSTCQPEQSASLPRPLSFFAVLLLLDVIAAFCMAFIEPQMIFYLYNALSWSPTQYGFMMGGYGLAMLVGQVARRTRGSNRERRRGAALPGAREPGCECLALHAIRRDHHLTGRTRAGLRSPHRA
jgi:MFS family permease